MTLTLQFISPTTGPYTENIHSSETDIFSVVSWGTNGQHTDNTTVESGVNVENGAIINAGGNQAALTGGTAISTTINAGGLQFIEGGLGVEAGQRFLQEMERHTAQTRQLFLEICERERGQASD